MDREKVIKGLECCTTQGFGCIENKKCPYGVQRYGSHCVDSMLGDALSLLKAQEPRVMTLDEVNRFVFGSPYIVETNIPGDEPRLMYGLYSHQGTAGNYTFDTVDRRRNLYDVDYDRFWRCWTSRPTDEQREAVPWD